MSPDFLAGLNEQQLEAVTLPHQSALILAGAGSGKTRVLTTRVAWLISTGQVSPSGLIAVTFTNKAAKEMLTRISAMLPINTRGMWVGTFHGLANRLLRVHHREAGLPQLFQILDTQDQLSLIKRLLKGLGVDEERYPPRQVQWFVAANKEEGLRAREVEAHDEFARRMKELYAAYDEQCAREGVVDFAELLLRSHELLAGNAALRDHYRARFRHILVDEFQDTNRLQYRWLKLLAGPPTTPSPSVPPLLGQEGKVPAHPQAGGERGNAIFAVGDDDQCLVEGTRVTMADGTTRRIERVRAGDKVLSAFGPGDFRPAIVTAAFSRSRVERLIEIRLRSGRKLVSTPEHTHFAGYVLGQTPQTYFTYLVMKHGAGYRVGTTQVYTKGQKRPIVGFRQRSMQEHADALWVLTAHRTENEARLQEMLLSLHYGLPTLPFVPRKGKGTGGLVHELRYIRRVFDSLDTAASAQRLLRDLGLDPKEPHLRPRSRNSNRRNITVTLCADRRGRHPMHRVLVMGSDAEGKRALQRAGFVVRRGKRGWHGWKVETVRADFGKAIAFAHGLKRIVNGELILKAHVHRRSVPFARASAVRPGMVMIDDEGRFDIVQSVRRLPRARRRVFDLNVNPTHNFVANGIVTHNSIYAFRGASAANMQDLQKDFAIERVIKLEQNYRSHGHILDAANALIGHNRRRLGKNLWTAEAKGEPLRVYTALTDIEEAASIVEEAQSLSAEGVALSDIAVLYRSNAQSRVLEHALFSAGMPYRVYGGLRFFERQEVKHALAYLRLVANPDDDGALSRVINFPSRGIGNRSLEQLQDAAQAGGTSLWAAALSKAEGRRQKAESQGEGEAGHPSSFILPPSSGKGIPAFVALIEQMRSATAGLPLPETIEHVIEASGLKAHYRAEKEGADRLENLAELVNAAATFVAERNVQPAGEAAGMDEPDELTAFLAHAALEAGEHQAEAGADALQLMTVHSAKGLEFHAIFVSGLEEGLFPHENSLTEADGIEEERRLMYVALTRARRRLYLSFSQSRLLHGQTRYGIASRFFQEIPEQLMRRVNGGFRNQGSGSRKGAARSVGLSSPIPQHPSLSPDSPWRVGQSVVHPTFGSGVIVGTEGRGADARVQVNFRNGGLKWLMLEYAKLVPA